MDTGVVNISLQNIDEYVTPTVSISDIVGFEPTQGTTEFRFTVSLSHAVASEVRVDFSTADGTASSTSGDYVHSSGAIVFDPGTPLQRTFTVFVNADQVTELEEQFFVNLSNIRNATLSDSQAIGTILNSQNSAPNAVNDSSTGSTSAVHAVTVLANDSDPENDPLTITHVNGSPVLLGTSIALDLGRLELLSANGPVNFLFFPNGQAGNAAVYLHDLRWSVEFDRYGNYHACGEQSVACGR